MSNTHTPESILGMARNFMVARLLLTGAELDLFTILSSHPLTAEEVTEKLKGNLRGVTILLDVLSALQLLVKTAGRYQTEPSVIPLLSSNQSSSVLPMVLHTATIWHTWSRLTDIIRGTVQEVRLEDRILNAERTDDLKAFIGAMHVVASATVPRVIAAIDPGQTKTLIDVGGGSGSYTIAFLNAVPDLKATLFDLPPVIEMARERLEKVGLQDRVTLIPGNFYKDELPSGHDLALLSAIIHQNSLEQNFELYQKVFQSLNSGGRIVIRDYVMDPDRTLPVEGAIFAVNMLANTPGGGTWTYGEIEEGLTKAGFNRVRLLKTENMFSLVEAFKP